ncbi:hypothetical protein Tco_1566509 [Tanacetum coccineum]
MLGGSRIDSKIMENKMREKARERMESNKDKNVRSNAETRKKWSLQKKESKALKKTTNKYSFLETLPKDDQVEINIVKDKMIVDQFLNKKIQQSVIEASNWSQGCKRTERTQTEPCSCLFI